MPGKAAEVWPGLEVERGTSLGAEVDRRENREGSLITTPPLGTISLA